MPHDGLDKYLDQFVKPKTQKGSDETVARVVDDELSKLGWSDNARLSLLGDLGRENAWNRNTIFGGHADPKNKAFNRGIISWQGSRRTNLDNYLKKQGVYGRNDDDELRGMVRFMDEEMRSTPEWQGVHAAMRKPDITTYDASESLRKYIKYVPNGKYNSFDPEFRVKNNARWAKKARGLGMASTGLNNYIDKIGVEQTTTPQSDDGLNRYLDQFIEPTATSGKPFMRPEDVGKPTPTFPSQMPSSLGPQTGVTNAEQTQTETPDQAPPKPVLERPKTQAEIDQEFETWRIKNGLARDKYAVDRFNEIKKAEYEQKSREVDEYNKSVKTHNDLIELDTIGRAAKAGMREADYKKAVADERVKYDAWRTKWGVDDTEEMRGLYDDERRYEHEQESRKRLEAQPGYKGLAAYAKKHGYNVMAPETVAAYNESLNGRHGKQHQTIATTREPQKQQKAPDGDQQQTESTYTLDLSNKQGAFYAEEHKRQVSAHLANELGVPYEIAEAVVGKYPVKYGDDGRGVTERDFKADAEAGLSRRVVVGADVKRKVLELNALAQERQRLYAQKLEEYAKTEIPTIADLLARKDTGTEKINGIPIDEAIEKERAAYAKSIEEKGLAGENVDPYREGVQSGELSPETRRGVRVPIDALNEQREALRRKFAEDTIKEYGSLAKYQSEQERIRSEYGTLTDSTRPMARPSEFILNVGRYFAKIPATVLKAAAMETDFNPATAIDPKDNPFLSAARAIEERVDASKNKDLAKELVVGDVAQGLGQIIAQGLLVPLTGGASMALPLIEGATQQYDEAVTGGATRQQRALATAVGGLAAAPDAFLKYSYLRRLMPNQRGGFAEKLAEKIFNDLARELPEQQARFLTARTVSEFIKQAPKGYFAEKFQERSEDWANKTVQKFTYAPQTEVFATTEREEQGYEAAGILGIIGAGSNIAIQKAQAKAADQEPLSFADIADQVVNGPTTKADTSALLKQDKFGESQPLNETQTSVSERPASVEQGEVVRDQSVKGEDAVEVAKEISPPDARVEGQEGVKGEVPDLQDVRSPSSTAIRNAANGTFDGETKITNTTVDIDTLKGGVSSGDSRQRIDDLKEQMQSPDGYIERLIVDDEGNVIEGQHRLVALQELGVKNVPVVQITEVRKALPDADELIKQLHKDTKLHREQAAQMVDNVASIIADGENPRDYEPPTGYADEWNKLLGMVEAAQPAELSTPTAPAAETKAQTETEPQVLMDAKGTRFKLIETREDGRLVVENAKGKRYVKPANSLAPVAETKAQTDVDASGISDKGVDKTVKDTHIDTDTGKKDENLPAEKPAPVRERRSKMVVEPPKTGQKANVPETDFGKRQPSSKKNLRPIAEVKAELANDLIELRGFTREMAESYGGPQLNEQGYRELAAEIRSQLEESRQKPDTKPVEAQTPEKAEKPKKPYKPLHDLKASERMAASAEADIERLTNNRKRYNPETAAGKRSIARIDKEIETAKRDLAGHKKAIEHHKTAADVPPLPESQQVSATAEPTAKEAKASVKKEKVNPRTGLTETQTEFLAKELRDRTYKGLKLEDVDAFVKEFGPEGLPLNSSAYSNEIEKPDYIDVPGDGSFKVFTVGQANSLHRKITGKPIPGLAKPKGAAIPLMNSEKLNAAMKAPFLGKPSKETQEKIAAEQERFVDELELDPEVHASLFADGDYVTYPEKPETIKEWKGQAREATVEQLQKLVASDTGFTQRQIASLELRRRGEPLRAEDNDPKPKPSAESSKKGDAEQWQDWAKETDDILAKNPDAVIIDVHGDKFTHEAGTQSSALGITARHIPTGSFAGLGWAGIDKIVSASGDVLWTNPNPKKFEPSDAPLRSVARQNENFDQPSSYTFKESDYRPKVVNWAKNKWGDKIAPNGKPVYQNFVRWFDDSKAVDENGEPLVVFHGRVADVDVFDKAYSGTASRPIGSGTEEGTPFWFTTDNDVTPTTFAGLAKVSANERDAARLEEQIDALYSRFHRNYGNEPLRASLIKEIQSLRAKKENLQDRATPGGQNVVPAYLRVERLYDTSTDEEYERVRQGFEDKFAANVLTPKLKGIALRNAKKGGFDGVVFRNIQDGGEPSDIYAVFEPNQIKSALGNSGNFSTEDDSILRSVAQPDKKNLIAAHNLSASKLRFADRLGGLALPSIAITSKDIPFTGYGEITLIADAAMVDPKSKVPVTDADMYSPRYPQQRVIVKDHKKFAKFWEPVKANWLKHYEKPEYSSIEYYSPYEALKDEGVRGLADNDQFAAYYFSQKGIELPKNVRDLRDLRFRHEEEIADYAADVLDEMGAEYKFFKGFTNMGNRRYGAYDLETVVKQLKSEMKEGEGWNYGAGSLRSKAATKFKSLKEIQKNRHRIVPESEMDAKKEEMNNRLWELADQYKQFYKYDADAFGYTDQFTNALMDGLKNRNLRRELQEYGFEGIDDYSPITDYLDELRNQPSEYFEAKPQRAVSLREFKAAAIPSDASQATRDILRRHGIRTIEYDRQTEGDRVRAVNEAVSEDEGTLFKVRTPESYALLTKELPTAHTQDLFDNIESKVTDEGELDVNEYAGETIRRLGGNVADKKGKPYNDVEIDGLTAESSYYHELAQAGRELRKGYKKAGYTEAQLKRYDQLLDNLDALADANEDYAIAFVYEDVLPHERRHVLDKRALKGRRIPAANLEKVLELENDKFRERYGNESDQTKGFEIIAAIANNENYGWTEQQKQDAKKAWADGILEVNPDLDIVQFAEIYRDAGVNDAQTQTSDKSGSEAVGNDQKDVPDNRGPGKGTRSEAEDKGQPEKAVKDGDRTATPESRAAGVSEEAVKYKNRKHAEYLRNHGLGAADVPYIPETERGWQQKGKEIVERSLAEKGDYSDAIAEFNNPKNISGGERTALAYELIDRLGSEGDYEAMREITDGVIVHEGQAGAILRAAQIVAKYDFAKAVETVTKSVKKQGKTLSDKDIDKLRRETAKYAQTEEELAAAIQLVAEAQAESDRLQAEIDEINKALEESNRKRTIDERLIAALRRQVSYWKNKKIAESRPRRTAVYKDLNDKREALLEKIREAFGEDAPLRMAAWRFDAPEKRPQIAKDAPGVFWHGSDNADLRGGTTGLHIGTYEAAKQALEARIGVPAEGEWDGTREYGKTLIAGKKTLAKPENKWKTTGYNVDAPENDYYPTDREYRAKYSDGTPVPFDAYPIIEPVKITGPMTAGIRGDWQANGLMKRSLKKGNARSGFFYKNEGEDAGSISAVVPNESHVERLWKDVGVELDEPLKSVAAPPIDDDTRNALVDYTSLQILEHVKYEDVIKNLKEITGLSDAEIGAIHADAVENLKGTGKASDKVKETLAIRNEHKREARRFRDGGLDLNRLDREILKGVDDAKLVFATLLWNRALNAKDFTEQMQKEFPGITAAEVKAVLKNVGERRDKAKAALKKQSAEKKAGKSLTDAELKQLTVAQRVKQSNTRAARQSLDRTFRNMGRSAAAKVAEGVMEAINFLKGTAATGEVSYLLRQGLLPLITESRAAIKGDWQGVGHGLQGDNELARRAALALGYDNVSDYLVEHSTTQFIEKVRTHARLAEAQAFGVRFSEIGDHNIADEHFSSKILEKIPVYKRLELAYTLPGDLQRLYIYDVWASAIEGQGLTTDEEILAKKYAARVVNALSGKGDVKAVLAKGGALSKLANMMFFSPSLLVSRFQSAYYLTTGFATAPKGMRMMMAKKGIRAYAVLGLVAYILGMNLDPDDDDFGKVRPRKGSWLAAAIGEDTQLNPLAGMDLPVQLAWRNAGGMFKALRTGDSGYFSDTLSETWQQMVTNKQNEPRFLRGKLSPSASWLVDYGMGTDYIGRPYTHWGAATSRLMPMSWGQVYDALLYDHYEAMMKEPVTIDRAKQRFNDNERDYANALSIMLPTFLGIGVNQYPKGEMSKATKKAAQMADYVSEKDAETIRIEGGLRNLIKEKIDLRKAGQDTSKVTAAIKHYARKYKVKLDPLEKQAASENGLLGFYSTKLSAAEIRRVLPLANDSERKVLEKALRSKEKK